MTHAELLADRRSVPGLAPVVLLLIFGLAAWLLLRVRVRGR
jgi:hypothetical protein